LASVPSRGTAFTRILASTLYPAARTTPTMSRRHVLLLSGMVLALQGCEASPSTSSLTVVEKDSLGIRRLSVQGTPGELPIWTVHPTPSFVVPGNQPPFLSDVGELAVLSDGRLIVEDNQSAELWMFDSEAAPRRLASRGDGPGEIRNVESIRVGRADSVFIFDRRHARMTVLTPSGTVAAVVDLPRGVEGEGTLLVSAWPLGDSIVLHSIRFTNPGDLTEGMRLGSRESVARLADRSGRPADRAVRFPAGLDLINQRFDGRSPFAANPAITVDGSLIIHARGAGYRLEFRTPDLALTQTLHWPGTRRPLDQDEVTRVRAEVEERFTQTGRAAPERVRALLDQVFAPEVVPEELPALGAIQVDDSGRVWVQAFRLASEEWQQEDAWHVLDPSGRPLARLSLPADTRLAGVRGNQVVLITRDELEVQNLGVYTLEQSTRR
jgi:hypothetical protein